MATKTVPVFNSKTNTHTHVQITVTLECGHKQEYWDSIKLKYPFDYCDVCDDTTDRTGKYPWELETTVVEYTDGTDHIACT